MTPKISALIIDPEKNKHDYSLVSTKGIVYLGDPTIDLSVVDSSDNVLTEINKHKIVDSIITVGNVNFSPLSNMSFEFRKKWVHFDEFDPEGMSNAVVSTFIANINRDRGDAKLFSIFTCTFNTPRDVFKRLYSSLLAQTYKNWNWWILDDSKDNGATSEFIEKLHDPRIVVVKNVTNHGTIGFNKHIIAMAADGDYLVEIDHDDEIVPDCLELLKKAFDKYEDVDFVFSHALEEMDGLPVTYTGDFGLGQGYFSDEVVNGVAYTKIPMTPDLNCLTVRHIVGLPNHVRCWKKDFYHKIGGHNIELAVLDDMDLLIRTFLYGKMCKINKILYIQHEGSSNDNHGRGSTTQGQRFQEILRTGVLLRWKYDEQIHKRILELGYEDKFWNEEKGYSEIRVSKETLPTINLTYNP
jgi:glycosyltransferase involved in cell wall biosynthesis